MKHKGPPATGVVPPGDDGRRSCISDQYVHRPGTRAVKETARGRDLQWIYVTLFPFTSPRPSASRVRGAREAVTEAFRRGIMIGVMPGKSLTANVARIAIFLAAAVGLALLWYAALLIPWITRTMLHGAGWVRAIALLSAFSVIAAIVLRRPVIRERSPERSAMMALGVPLIGALLFAWAITLLEWHRSTDGGSRGPDGDLLFTLFVVTVGTVITLAAKAFYIVIPMGALTVYVMRNVGDTLWPELRPDDG